LDRGGKYKVAFADWIYAMSAKPVKAMPIQFYPRQTKGRFNNWRVLMMIITQLIFFGGPM
jgi:hypothetical protein